MTTNPSSNTEVSVAYQVGDNTMVTNKYVHSDVILSSETVEDWVQDFVDVSHVISSVYLQPDTKRSL